MSKHWEQPAPTRTMQYNGGGESLGVHAFAILVGPMRSIIATVSLCGPVFRPVDVLAVMYSPPVSCAARLLSLLSCLPRIVQTGSAVRPSLVLSVAAGSFRRSKATGTWLTNQSRLIRRLRTNGAVPPFLRASSLPGD